MQIIRGQRNACLIFKITSNIQVFILSKSQILDTFNVNEYQFGTANVDVQFDRRTTTVTIISLHSNVCLTRIVFLRFKHDSMTI